MLLLGILCVSVVVGASFIAMCFSVNSGVYVLFFWSEKSEVLD